MFIYLDYIIFYIYKEKYLKSYIGTYNKNKNNNKIYRIYIPTYNKNKNVQVYNQVIIF